LFVLGAILATTVSCAPSSFAQSDGLAAKSQQAKEFMAEGKFAEAIPLYRELNQAVPNNPGLLLNLGMALHLAGDEGKAIAPLEAAVKLDPKLPPAWLFLGAARLHLGETLPAINALKTLLRLQPEHQDARLMLADALLSINRDLEAGEEYRKVADLDPGSSAAWYGLGRSCEALSVRAFSQLEKAAPGSAYWLALLAEARFHDQQFASSFYLYRQAQEKLPSLRGTHAAVAEIYRKTGHADWAAVEEEKEQQLRAPDCARDQLECDFQAGRYDELIATAKGQTTPESFYWRSRAYNQLALDAYTRLGQLPSSASSEELMAKIESNRKQYTEAVKHWEEALKFLPTSAHNKEELAISLFQAADLNRARELLQELLKSNPLSPRLNYYLGEVLLKLQKPEEALPYLNKATHNDPGLLTAQASLANTYLALGQAEKAIPHLKAALSIDEDGSLHYQLGLAYRARGQMELARQTLQQYQRIHDQQEKEKQSLNREIKITAP